MCIGVMTLRRAPADLGVLDKLSIFGAFTMQYVHICGVFGNI